MIIKNKREFYKELAEKNGVTAKEAEVFWLNFIELLDETLSSQDDSYVLLPNLGKLKAYPLEGRRYKNPYTLEHAVAEPKRKVQLNVFPAFKEKHSGFIGK